MCGGSTAQFYVIMTLGFSGQSNSLNFPHQMHVFCPTGNVYDPHLELCRTSIASAPKQTGFDKYSVSAWILRKTTYPFGTLQEQLFFMHAFNRALIDLSVSNSKINGTYINLSAHEVKNFPNKSVLWNVGGKVYAEGNYEKQNGTIWLCTTNFSSNGTNEILVKEVVPWP